MTMANERKNAIKNTRLFLRALLDPKLTPKVPRAVREMAYCCLKHFPGDMHIDEVLNERHHEQEKKEKKLFRKK